MKFVCPRCGRDLQPLSALRLLCVEDGLNFQQAEGVWDFLLPESKTRIAQFVMEYEAVRAAEGRYSAESEYYRRLPFADLTGRFSADWKIRAASYLALEKILPAAGKILDLGAGNGWLSNRLAAKGLEVYAVDLLSNKEDGLGVWPHYLNSFIPMQAEFDRLPFESHYFDVIIFNASFHYSQNYEKTLASVLRVLQKNGSLIIADSPVYLDSNSGKEMLAERNRDFTIRYGFASNTLESEGYITYAGMQNMGKKFGIRWRHIRPFYGLRWLLKPIIARLRKTREPAQFGLWVGTLTQPAA